MGTMNQSQIKLGLDPVLTTVSQQTRGNKFNMGDAFFPSVPVDSRSGQIVVWGDEAFQLVETNRAPGAIFKEVDISYSSSNYVLNDHGLSTGLAVEDGEEAKSVNIDLVIPKINNITEKMKMSMEKKKADLALNPANYSAANKITLAGASQFNDPTSDPRGVVKALVEAIEDATGEEVTHMGFSKLVFRELQAHPDIIAAAKVLGLSEKTITTANLADFFDIPNIVVSTARFKDANTGVWDYFWGKDILLAAVPKKGESKQYKSFAYTYQLKGYPFTRKKYWDDARERWVWKVKDANIPVITSIDSAALITDAVA